MTRAQQVQYQDKTVALIGYGVTGKACAEYLLQKGANVHIFDREIHKIDEALAAKPRFRFFSLNDNTVLSAFDMVVVSPGVNLNQGFIQRYIASGFKVIGDIELFARENQVPIIAVTGSNGKSTVVDMLTQALRASGYKVGLGGNFGTSALAMLGQKLDYVVLELSSFQLESIYSLRPVVSCVLNITPDHMDRHGSMHAYALAKQTIYQQAKHVIYNREDTETYPISSSHMTLSSIGLLKSQSSKEPAHQYHFHQTHAGIYLGNELVLDASLLANSHAYQLLNIQVVLACAYLLDIEKPRFINSLYAYKGLAHRFETVHQSPNCIWINDSKATNPGAAIAAVNALSKRASNIILIAGGDSKGADMSALKTVLAEHVSFLVLLGKDRELFTHCDIPYALVKDMSEAVDAANTYAQQLIQHNQQQAAVLLSPACASIDMFDNYQARGDYFNAAVKSLVSI